MGNSNNKETVEALKRLAHLADKADGNVDGKIQRSTIDHPTGEMIGMVMFDSDLQTALRQLKKEIPIGKNTINIPSDKELAALVERSMQETPQAKPPIAKAADAKPPIAKAADAKPSKAKTEPPCEETWLGGWFSAPSGLPDWAKTNVCPKGK